MENVVIVIGPGQIGQAIARRVGVAKHIVLADRSEANANAAAEVMSNAGYQVSVATVDVSSREAVLALVGKATGIGEIVGLIHAAGVSPSHACTAGGGAAPRSMAGRARRSVSRWPTERWSRFLSALTTRSCRRS